jgi:hypothetical protein
MAIEFHVTDSTTSQPQDEAKSFKTVLVSGTFNEGIIVLEVRIKQGWAPVVGGSFTEIGAHRLTLENVGQYRVAPTGFTTGDVWIECY